MIRPAPLLLALGLLAACSPDREPRANCFEVTARGSGAGDCTFSVLAGPGDAGGAP